MKKDQLERSLPSFTDIQDHVFKASGGIIHIGGEQIKDDLRSILRDEAEYIEKSHLWEILNASVTNEAYILALLQSEDFESVRFAKAMHHWSHFMRNVLHILAQK